MFPRLRPSVTPILLRASSSSSTAAPPPSVHVLQSKLQPKSLRQISAQGGATSRAVDLAIKRTEGWYAEKQSDGDAAAEGEVAPVEKKKVEVRRKSSAGLGSSLLGRRKTAGGEADADAQAIVDAATVAPPPRSTQQRPKSDRAPRAPASSTASPKSSYSSNYVANASSTPRTSSPRPPRSPASASASASGKPNSKPRSGPSKFPSSPRSNSRNSRPERTAAVPLVYPTRFTPNAPIDLAALISQDLQTRFSRSPAGTLPFNGVVGSEEGEQAAQSARLEALKERMGDYSRFWPDGSEEGKEAVGAARRMLAMNSSVGLKERETLLKTLEKALGR